MKYEDRSANAPQEQQLLTNLALIIKGQDEAHAYCERLLGPEAWNPIKGDDESTPALDRVQIRVEYIQYSLGMLIGQIACIVERVGV